MLLLHRVFVVFFVSLLAGCSRLGLGLKVELGVGFSKEYGESDHLQKAHHHEQQPRKHAVKLGRCDEAIVMFGLSPLPSPVNVENISSALYSLDVDEIRISPKPLQSGQNMSIEIIGTTNITLASGVSTKDIVLVINFGRTHGDLRTEEATLCEALGYGKSCPPFVPTSSTGAFDLSSVEGAVSIPPLDYLRYGVYTVRVQAFLASKPLGKCTQSSSVIVYYGWTDFLAAIFAFCVSSGASVHLGKVTPGALPLITGYLIVGVVLGPMGTNFITQYHIICWGRSLTRSRSALSHLRRAKKYSSQSLNP